MKKTLPLVIVVWMLPITKSLSQNNTKEELRAAKQQTVRYYANWEACKQDCYNLLEEKEIEKRRGDSLEIINRDAKKKAIRYHANWQSCEQAQLILLEEKDIVKSRADSLEITDRKAKQQTVRYYANWEACKDTLYNLDTDKTAQINKEREKQAELQDQLFKSQTNNSTRFWTGFGIGTGTTAIAVLAIFIIAR